MWLGLGKLLSQYYISHPPGGELIEEVEGKPGPDLTSIQDFSQEEFHPNLSRFYKFSSDKKRKYLKEHCKCFSCDNKDLLEIIINLTERKPEYRMSAKDACNCLTLLNKSNKKDASSQVSGTSPRRVSLHGDSLHCTLPLQPCNVVILCLTHQAVSRLRVELMNRCQVPEFLPVAWSHKPHKSDTEGGVNPVAPSVFSGPDSSPEHLPVTQPSPKLPYN